MAGDTPMRPVEPDGIYPRCVYGNTEIYGPAVIAYSKGAEPCHVCGKFLPKEYVKL